MPDWDYADPAVNLPAMRRRQVKKMVAYVCFKTIDGRRCREDIGIYRDTPNARDAAQIDAARKYAGFMLGEKLKWTPSADFRDATEALVKITGVRYVVQKFPFE